jgi:CAAX protease family protein
MPALPDHLLVACFAGLFPIYGLFTYQRMLRKLEAGGTRARRRTYLATMIWLSGLTIGMAAVWGMADRPVADLGLGPSWGAGFWITLVLAGALVGFLLLQWRAVSRSTDAQQRLRDAAKSVEPLLPHTPPELSDFLKLSVTAGVCEELLFRGYLIWYLGNFVGLWPAVLLSSALFGYGHIYQGPGGVFKTGIVGLVAAIMFVYSGSLWIPIVFHAAVDAIQGATAYVALRGPNSLSGSVPATGAA